MKQVRPDEDGTIYKTIFYYGQTFVSVKKKNKINENVKEHFIETRRGCLL